MKAAQIVLLCVFAACVYGVVHDQITARVCIEYFTVAHPPLFHATSPTVLAVCWGIAATAGIGAVFGTVLALVCQSPAARPCSLSYLCRSIAILLAAMGVGALASGVLGYQLSSSGVTALPLDLAAVIPGSRHHLFMAVWFAHGASYLVGLAGGGLLCFLVWRSRGRPSVISLFPRTRAAVIRTVFIVVLAVYIIWIRFHAG